MIELFHGDCLEKMKSIPDKSIDMVLTSPPYDNLRTYNGTLDWNFEIFMEIAKELVRVLKEGGVIVWIVGDATIKGSESGTSFKQALYFKDNLKLNLHDTMIYAKNNVVPLTHNRYEQSFEYMFILSKGKPNTFNAINDKPNKWSGHFVHGTCYSKDIKKRITYHNQRKVSEFGRRHNIFYYNNSGNKKIDHPAIFPEALASDHIISWSNCGDIVLDPFMGSGTTGLICKKLNRNFIGIEKVEKYFEIAKRRILNEHL